MGLASQFGNENPNYQCKNCGHTMALYAPCCPRCLDKTLIQVKTEKVPEGFRRPDAKGSDTPKASNPIVPVAVLTVILAIAIAASGMFAPPRPTVIQTEPPKTTVKPSSTRVSSSQSKRVKRPSRPVVSKSPGSSPAVSKPATPMKLWEASGDDEGDN